jgi:ABC-type amino acid transport substrate-binding protein
MRTGFKLAVASGIAATLQALLISAALAQVSAPPTIAADLHRGQRQVVGDKITFCVDDRTPVSAVDIAIAEAIAESQLIDAEFFRISEMPGRADQVQITDDLMFVLLSDECEAFIGMKGGERITLTEYVTVSRPYYHTRYVIASKRPELTSFQAVLDTNTKIGIPAYSRMNSSVAYFEPKTSRRIFSTEQVLFDALMADEIEAGMFFGPDLVTMAGDQLADLTIARVDPVPNGEVPILMQLYVQQTFVRGLIDDAIAVLEADGTIDAILEEHGYTALP